MRQSSGGSVAAADLMSEAVDVFQAATRILVGVALRSLDLVAGEVSLAQFRMLAVLGELGRDASAQVARSLGLEPSTVSRLADRLVAAGYVTRGRDPRHRSVVTLELTGRGQALVDGVTTWRRNELARILGQLGPGELAHATALLRAVVAAAGEGYGAVARGPVPL